MSEPGPPPEGFAVGHWTDARAATGCTVVIAPPGARGAVEIRGGGPGTRETDVLGPLSGTPEVTGVVLAGGSAYGLAAADGAMRWCEEHGRGYGTPAGVVPIVPAAVLYDLAEGEAGVRPGPEAGYAACEAASGDVPERGRVGAGSGATVGKVRGHSGSHAAGIGYARAPVGEGTVAAIAAVNAFGDVIDADGTLLAGPQGGRRTREELARLPGVEGWPREPGGGAGNTTLVCLMTDAGLDRAGCARVARMATAGVGRAVDPVFSDLDGDVVFCLATGRSTYERFTVLSVGTVATAVVAAAIRDGVRAASA